MNRQPVSSQTSKYDVKHLATFNVGKSLSAEDGVKKLKALESSNSINLLDCELLIDRKYLSIIDKQTKHEIEVIPLKLIDEPTSVINEDKYDSFNNILLFTANYNLKNSEMHFFQCLNSDSVDIVDEILAVKEGKQYNRTTNNQRAAYTLSLSSTASTLVQPREPAPSLLHQKQDLVNNKDSNNNNSNNNTSKSSYIPLGESINEDVQMLNHCFDDVERFITKLQNKINREDSDDSSKKKKSKKKSSKKSKETPFASVDLQNNPLPDRLEDKHYIDILQKFKLSFNLLAKLKQHIHDPNSPELVHFLFTPLSIIVSALNSSNSKLCNAIWSPLMTKEGKDLLLNCLTSKEYDLWQSLGDAWFMSDDELTTQIHSEPYNPIFYDGWSPIINQNYPKFIKKHASNYDIQQSQQKPKTLVSKEFQLDERSVVNNQIAVENEKLFQEMKQWAFNLHQNGVKIYEVISDREGNNDKELSVKSGELVEILDDRRNWWRIRNVYGNTGHAPHTILQPFEFNASKNLNSEKFGYF